MSSHDTRGGDQSINLGGEGNIVHGGIHLTLGELDQVDQAHKIVLRTRFEQQVRDFPENAGYQFALGLSYLDLKLYDLAIERFKKALGQGANEADLLYYLALANLRGKPLRTLTLALAREAQSLIEAAIEGKQEHGHYYLLLALIKRDFFAINGLRVSPPPWDDLLAKALEVGVGAGELRQLVRHVHLDLSSEVATRE